MLLKIRKCTPQAPSRKQERAFSRGLGFLSSSFGSIFIARVKLLVFFRSILRLVPNIFFRYTRQINRIGIKIAKFKLLRTVTREYEMSLNLISPSHQHNSNEGSIQYNVFFVFGTRRFVFYNSIHQNQERTYLFTRKGKKELVVHKINLLYQQREEEE